MSSSVQDAVFELASAIGSGRSQPVGTYRFDLVQGTWEWSDEIYAMYGYERGEVLPTSELMLAHNHPDERRVDIPALEASCRTGRPFGYVHRILDSRSQVKTLAVSGTGRLDDGGERVLEATGFFIDLTAVGQESYQAEVSKALAEILVSRASIEQAKGVIMLAYGLRDEDAFDVLRHHSSRANVKVRDLADGIVELARSGALVGGGERAINAFFASASRLIESRVR